MGDWRDIHSTNKTIESYMAAFNDMVKLKLGIFKSLRSAKFTQ